MINLKCLIGFLCDHGSDYIAYKGMGLYNYMWFVGKCELAIMHAFCKTCGRWSLGLRHFSMQGRSIITLNKLYYGAVSNSFVLGG